MATDDWLLPPPPKSEPPKRRLSASLADTPVPTEAKPERPPARLSFRGPSSDELEALDRALKVRLTEIPRAPPPPAPPVVRPSASPPAVTREVRPPFPPRAEKSPLESIIKRLERQQLPPKPLPRPRTPETPSQDPPSRLDLAAVCAVADRPFILKFRSKSSNGGAFVFEGTDTDIEAENEVAPASAGNTVPADKLHWQGFSECPICGVVGGELIQCTTCKRLVCGGRVVERARDQRRFRCCQSCGGGGPIAGFIKAFSGAQRANRTIKSVVEPAENPVDRKAPEKIGNCTIKAITYRR